MGEFLHSIVSFCESVLMFCLEWRSWNLTRINNGADEANLEELHYKVIGQVTGCGCNNVYRCFQPDEQRMVFVKQIFISDQRNEKLRASIAEKMNSFQFFHHPYIIRTLDSFSKGKYLYIVYEYFSVDLSYMISLPNILRLPKIKSILEQILSAVEQFHSFGVILGEIKPQHIQMKFSDHSIKLADFGFVGAFGDHPYWLPSYALKSSQYSAPELLLRTHGYSKASDMWSVGSIFGAMVIGQEVFKGKTPREHLTSIFRLLGSPTGESRPGVLSKMCTTTLSCFSKCEPKNLANKFPGLEPEGIDLLSKMLCLDPNQRISAEDALEHHFFNPYACPSRFTYKEVDVTRRT